MTVFAGPPLEVKAYEHMTLKQWMSSMRKYNDSTEWGASNRDIHRGGIIAHSRAFTAEVSKQPEKFYKLIFDIGKQMDISIMYLAAGLEGLVKGEYDLEKIKILIKTFWKRNNTEFRKTIIRALKHIDKNDSLDIELINILKEYAINDPDPIEESWQKENGGYYGGDPITAGLNSVRGHAAWALGRHGFKTSLPDELLEIFAEISKDKSIAVRSCLIQFLHGMIKWNRRRTMCLFFELTKDSCPEVIQNGVDSIYYLMSKSNFTKFIPHIREILPYIDSKLGGILMTAYIRKFPGSKTLLEEGFKINEEIKAGAIDFASRHLTSEDKQTAEKSKQIYLRFMNDASEEIRFKYSMNFTHFKVEEFEKIYDLIFQYSKSKVIENNQHHFFKFLEKCVRREPERCIDLIENYTKFEKPDPGQNWIGGEPLQIIIEAYNRTYDDEYKENALNLFDSLLQNARYRTYGINILKEHDRE
jgi:hypothetical protein